MESLSGNQVKDLKGLYASIYKSDDQEISEEEMKGEKDLTKEKKEPIIINLPGGGTTKIYPGSPDYEKAKKGENFSIDAGGERGKINVNKNDSGKLTGKVDVLDTSKKNEVKPEVKNEVKPEVKNEVKPEVTVKEKPLLSKKLPDTTKLGSTIKPVKPSSARDKMIAKNEIKLGIDRITNLRNKNADFQAMKKGDITKADFIKQYPKSQTAMKSKLKALESYEPYDLVLDYVLSEGHAETVEEAHYVMTQMDADTIQGIVEEQKKTLIEKPDDGYIGPKFLGIKNPMNKARKDYQMDYKLKKLSGTGDSPQTRDMLDIPRDYEITPEQKKKYGFK